MKDFLNIHAECENNRTVLVNCVECYTTKILYEHILEELVLGGTRCDNFKEFVEILRQAKNVEQSGFVVALDNADRLRDMDNNILPSLLRLQEFTGLNICVLLISQIPLEKYYCKTGVSEVISLYTPQYTKVETLKILSGNFENTVHMLKCRINDNCDAKVQRNQLVIVEQITQEFYNNYLNIFLSVFYKACRDVPELKITASKCFFTYMEPVLNGNVELSDVARLWRNIAVPLRSSLSEVYMRFDKVESEVRFNLKRRICF